MGIVKQTEPPLINALQNRISWAMDIRKQVGLNVKKLRKKRGLSQEEFAFECDLHRTYISGVERGVRNPTLTVLEQIARGLRIKPHELLK